MSEEDFLYDDEAEARKRGKDVKEFKEEMRKLREELLDQQ